MRPSGSALSSFSAGGGSSLFGTADAASDDDDAEDDNGGGNGGSPARRGGMFSPFPQHRPFVVVEKTCWDEDDLSLSFKETLWQSLGAHLTLLVDMLKIHIPQGTISVSISYLP